VNNFQIYIIIILILSDLIVTATRAGVLNARYARLVALQEAKQVKIDKTVELITRRARTRSSLKLAQALLRASIAGMLFWYIIQLSETQTIEVINTTLILVAIAFVTWLIEFILERGILNNPELWAVRMTQFAYFFIILLTPILVLPLSLSKSDTERNLITITEDELMTLVDASQQAGEIEKDESEMIHSVFEFGDTMAREIMVPRVDALILDVNTSLKEAADKLLESGYSRVPVYEDQIDNIIGLLYTKDMLKVWRLGNGVDSLRELLRPAKFVPETKMVDELLDEMQAARVHIAVVVDEYGGVAGVVTLEDIVEEIFGEIQDEYDDEEEELFQEISPTEYIFDGKVLLEEVNEIMGINLPTDEIDTVGGLIFARIGEVPTEGETLSEGNVLLTVEELNERRVQKVRIEIVQDDPPSE
jgi:CBS domain containing-hemolysin-like protein